VPVGYSVNGSAGKGLIQKEEDSARSQAGSEDTFGVKFPENASEADRVLLVAATILIDYSLYDDPPKQEMPKK